MDHLVGFVGSFLYFIHQKLTQRCQLLLGQNDSEGSHAVAGPFTHIHGVSVSELLVDSLHKGVLVDATRLAQNHETKALE